jgi:hypothetical protein
MTTVIPQHVGGLFPRSGVLGRDERLPALLTDGSAAVVVA